MQTICVADCPFCVSGGRVEISQTPIYSLGSKFPVAYVAVQDNQVAECVYSGMAHVWGEVNPGVYIHCQRCATVSAVLSVRREINGREDNVFVRSQLIASNVYGLPDNLAPIDFGHREDIFAAELIDPII